MRQIEAELDHGPEDGSFQVARLTDENGNDVTYLVERGTIFHGIAELETLLAAEFGGPVAIVEA